MLMRAVLMQNGRLYCKTGGFNADRVALIPIRAILLPVRAVY